MREVERLQQEKKHERDRFVARASSSDPEAHVMRNGEGGTVPSYNVQLLTDTQHGIVVNVEATTDAIDYRQMKPALERCATTLGRKPKQIVADGDYTNHASVQAAAEHGVDFYGSWQDSWRAVERDAQGRHAEFLASAFPYDAAQDRFTCPAGQTLTHHALMNRDNGVRTHVYRAPKKACPNCPLRDQVRAATGAAGLAALDHAPARTIGDDRVQAEDGHRGSKTNLRATLADRRVPARLDQRALRPTTVPLPRSPESSHGSDLGLPKLQPDEMVRPKADTASTASVGSFQRSRQNHCQSRIQFG